jgi:hypothetical protein
VEPETADSNITFTGAGAKLKGNRRTDRAGFLHVQYGIVES